MHLFMYMCGYIQYTYISLHVNTVTVSICLLPDSSNRSSQTHGELGELLPQILSSRLPELVCKVARSSAVYLGLIPPPSPHNTSLYYSSKESYFMHDIMENLQDAKLRETALSHSLIKTS